MRPHLPDSRRRPAVSPPPTGYSSSCGSRRRLPTQRRSSSEGDADAGASGIPQLRELAELNRAIHDAAGQPERYALDQRAAVQGHLEDLVAAHPANPTPDEVLVFAGRLAHSIASAQSFRDGNRRTAYWATRGYLKANGFGHLMFVDDHMVARYLNYLVEDQGRGRPARVTPERFAALFRRRRANSPWWHAGKP